MGRVLNKRVLRELLPPLFLDWILSRRGKRLFFKGPYRDWNEAAALATGYESKEILERVSAAVRKVKCGEATYERDSVLFDKVDYPFPVLAGMLRQASMRGGSLHVLDIGGSLGSTYFQCRAFLTTLKELRWSVVEQERYVACGREEFQDDQLHFYNDIEECLKAERSRPDVVLLSGVLQYLRDPYALLAELIKHEFPQILVDRTPFASLGADVLTVEVVPEWIYRASYPMWVFAPHAIARSLGEDYCLMAEFPAVDGEMNVIGIETTFRGAIFERKRGRV